MNLGTWTCIVIGCGSALLAAPVAGCGKGPGPPKASLDQVKSAIDKGLADLKSADPQVRREAAMALGAAGAQDERIVPALRAAMDQEKNPRTRMEIEASLRNLAGGGP